MRRPVDIPQRDTRIGLGYQKHLAEKTYDAALAEHGPDHPSTHAALGRFVGLYGERFLEIYEEPIPEGSEHFDRALNRQMGVYGQSNKGARKHALRANSRVA
jgi:hypothetical protein